MSNTLAAGLNQKSSLSLHSQSQIFYITTSPSFMGAVLFGCAAAAELLTYWH